VLLSLKSRGIIGGLRSDNLGIFALLMFAITMIGMFLVSTLYHSIQHKEAKRILHKLDHSMIFIFIAGTYTPFCLIALEGPWGWSLFIAEWILALTGITLNVFNFKYIRKIEITAYIMMGWAVVIGFVPLIRNLPLISLILLIAGGISYTLGTIWYRKKEIKHTHAVWHSFVLIGAVCHWFSVWLFLH
jgi:hemolysin III